MINLNCKLMAKVKEEVNIKGVDHDKIYQVVGSVTKQLEDKETKKLKYHDQIVILSNEGHWIELYPGKCILSIVA